MFSAGDRVVVAVSGGPDSICLLDVLHSLSSEFGITLHVAHLNHEFRGAESADDARFVAAIAARLQIPATIEAFDVPAFCRERGFAPQEGARDVRYRFLQRVANATNATRIATGHTADDQAETLIMRLMRGAGTDSLSGIPPKRGAIIRPLIDVTRTEVMEYMNAKSLEYRTDPSNAKPLYTRNRIRQEVLPVLKQFNPRIIKTLAAEASLLRDENDAIETHLNAVADRLFIREGDIIAVKRDEFMTLPIAFQRRLLRKLVNLLGAETSELNLPLAEEALAFLSDAQTGRIMTLLPDVTITREYDRILFGANAPVSGFCLAIALSGSTTVPNLGIDVETVLVNYIGSGPESTNYDWQALFDYAKMGPLLTLRSRQQGDWFCPAGMGGRRKKIQDFFVDEKVPRSKRDSIPLLISGDAIIWVVGFRTDERFLPGPETKKVLVVGIKKTIESVNRCTGELPSNR